MRGITMKMDKAMEEAVRSAATREGRTVSGWLRFHLSNLLKQK